MEPEDLTDLEQAVSDTPVCEGQVKRTPTPGIVYLSRIPPYMKPLKIRHVFSRYGTVGRVFLQPEGLYHTSIDLIHYVTYSNQCT